MKNKFYEFYQDKYHLEKIDLNISNDKILFLIFDDNSYYYLKNNKFITTNEDIYILDFIKNLNLTYKLEICNYYPICFCQETLVLGVRSSIVSKSLLKRIKYNQINKTYKKLIDYHRSNAEILYMSSNIVKEISMSQKYIKRYKFHEKIIKKYILTEKKRKKKELKELLFKIIPNNKKSIIDVSCGDNSDVFSIAKKKKYHTIVGNDICINYLYTQKDKDIFYTNDDVELNNIKENAYDVAFCKNTLHHMNNLTNINNILNFLKKIAKQIIIIEILNPKDYKGLPKFLNKYLYTKFLKDVGSCYLNETQLRMIINNNFTNHFIQYEKFHNILGVYMVVKIKRK